MTSNETSSAWDPVIGIDLGTSFVSASVYRDGKVEHIPNRYGNYLTPSCVAYSKQYGRMTGEDADNQRDANPNNTFYGVKSLIGENSDDVSAANTNYSIFTITKKGFTRLILPNGDSEVDISPSGVVGVEAVEILAALLEAVKQDAEKYLGQPVNKAVITVPAYFRYFQRYLICEAATLAGLECSDIIADPEAAALAYARTPLVMGQPKNVMIVDIGGGGISSCVASVKVDMVEIRAIAGANFCGGQAMVKRILDHFLDKYKEINNKHLGQDMPRRAHLRVTCERAMIMLSTSTEGLVPIGQVYPSIEGFGFIGQPMFGYLIDDLIRGYVKLIQKCLSDAKMEKTCIDNVIVIGGCSRIPKVRTQLMEFFEGQQVTFEKHLTVDGAAIVGGVPKDNMVFLRVTPYGIGVKVPSNGESNNAGDMHFLVKRGTTIPTKETQRMQMQMENDDSQSVSVEIYEGDQNLAQDNHFLGTVTLADIGTVERNEKGERKVELDVTFDINIKNELKVTVVHKATEQSVTFDVSEELALFREKDVKIMAMMKNNAKKIKEKDNQREWKLAKDTLVDTCFMIDKTLRRNENYFYWKGKVSPEVRDVILDKIVDVKKWIRENELAEKPMLQQKLEEVKAMCRVVNAAFLLDV